MKIVDMLKEYVESFDDARFVSVNPERPNEVIFARRSTGAFYSEPFAISGGRVIVEAVNCSPIGFAASDDGSVRSFAKAIVGVIEADTDNFGERYAALVEEFKKADIGSSCETKKGARKNPFGKRAKKPVADGFMADKVDAVSEAVEAQLESARSMFGKGDRLVPGVKDPAIVEMYGEELSAKARALAGKVARYSDFVDAVRGVVEDQAARDVVFDGVLEGADEGVFIARLAAVKRETGAKFNVAKVAVEAAGLVAEARGLFDDDNIIVNPLTANTPIDPVNVPVDQKTFFKFRVGVFSPKDLEVMMRELQAVLCHQGEMTQESMQEISMYLRTIEYMWRTGEIVDAIVAQMIKDFNEKYGGDWKGPLARGLAQPGLGGSAINAKGIQTDMGGRVMTVAQEA